MNLSVCVSKPTTIGTCTMSTDHIDIDRFAVVVLARHGERLDYVCRDSGENWVSTAERPFDPPLTNHGMEQAVFLGQHLASELTSLGFPPISVVYSSPLLRCRETALGVRQGLSPKSTNLSGVYSQPPIRVELGLAESMNEDWYRSWCLPGSDGTWGYMVNGSLDYDPETIHPLARQPVQSLLNNWKADGTLDHSYKSQIDVLTKPYALSSLLLETREEQRARMGKVARSLCQGGSTILLVSHGGPISHLYEEIMGEQYHHGEASYCAYSIYKCPVHSDAAATTGRWEVVRVNVAQSSYQTTPES
jgi:broad specificity phosphatase PhoE